MPIANSQKLKDLIQSLSKSEKRYIHLYIKRLDTNKDSKYFQLLNYLEKNPFVDDQKLKQLFNFKSITQFANTKRHLYQQILHCLRYLHQDESAISEHRYHQDVIEILIRKGLPSHAEYFTGKSKNIDLTNSNTDAHSLISDLIINGHENENENSSLRFEDICRNITNQILSFGFTRTNRELELRSQTHNYIKSIFESIIHKSAWVTHAFNKYNIILNFYNMDFELVISEVENSIQYLNSQKESFQYPNHESYILNYYNLKSLYFQGSKDQFINEFNSRDNLISESSSLYEKYWFKYGNELEAIYLFAKRDFENLNKYLDKEEIFINNEMADIKSAVTALRIFNFSCYHAYLGNYSKSSQYLNRIISSPSEKIGMEVFHYSRLIHLLCHYRENNFELVDNILTSVRQGFINNKLNNKLTELIFLFTRKGVKALNFGLKDEINMNLDKLSNIQSSNSFDKLSFCYFDFSLWLKSIRDNCSIKDLKFDK